MELVDQIAEKIQLSLADFAYDEDVMVEEKYRLAELVCNRISYLQKQVYAREMGLRELRTRDVEIDRLNAEIKVLLEGNIDTIDS